MTFRGQDILTDLDKKLLISVWDRSGKEGPIISHDICDTSLSELADIIGFGNCESIFERIHRSDETLTAESFADPLRQLSRSLRQLCESLEVIDDFHISRVYFSSSSGRFCADIADVEVTAFVDNLDASLDEDILQSLITCLRPIATGDSIRQDGYSLIFDIGIFTICLTLCYDYSGNPLSQRLAVISKLKKLKNLKMLTDDDLSKHSVANIEQLTSSYDNENSSLSWSSARLLKLWQLRNLHYPENPFLFEIIALNTAASHRDEPLIRIFQLCLERLVDGANGADVVDPTNEFNCLSDRVCHWDEISRKAGNSLTYLRGGGKLNDVFPPIKYKAYGA